MAGYVGRLEAGERLDAAPYFAGPWRSFERVDVEVGAELTLTATDTEHAVFVISGQGSFTAGGAHGAFTPGSAFTVGWQAVLSLKAGAPVELFITTLAVPAE